VNVFVTAGNTQTPLDTVRCVTNVFTGKTGARIAAQAYDRGHAVTLATSHPDALRDLASAKPRAEPLFSVKPYRTYDDLEAIMAAEIGSGRYDAVIHAAAVNDYHVAGVYGLTPGVTFDDTDVSLTTSRPTFRDITAGKVKGNHDEIWVRMVPAAKLVDRIRAAWGFRGVLVKFKLEVGVGDTELIAIGEQSRRASRADWLVANTFEGRNDWAYLLGGRDGPERIPRDNLPRRLMDVITASVGL
jgi:phosphopantothenate-cysteine ligase/phosphopantothenoylcysteine decarboxylase/phosphopantothenate--cysteine ligase